MAAPKCDIDFTNCKLTIMRKTEDNENGVCNDVSADNWRQISSKPRQDDWNRGDRALL